ncbi:MFS transporter [Nonomuraea lactucae]|uniref:MFS transporter n=1 Tax=Nonomuraea lactucae TaxID=2249762 RepID=UPI0013B360E6|nr:MFS transporter [Nonomuraea lactucae]
MSPSDPVLRIVRAAVFTVVCVVVSAGGHFYAGGAAVAPGVVFAGAGAAFALAYGLNGSERSRGAVLAATIGAQAVLHELFALAGPGDDLSARHSHTSVGMVLVHLTVAWLTGWWLHRGESAFWLLLRLWGAAPLARSRWLLADPVTIPTPVRRTVPVGESVSCAPWELTTTVQLRGPPARRHAG